MRCTAGLLLFVSLCCITPIHAAGVDGYVYFLAMNTEFQSNGEAQYYNDLQQNDNSAALSGAHRVSGPYSYETRVQGYGHYFYILEGPAEPGACYGTSLNVVADPPGVFNNVSNSWTGPARCAPVSERGPVVISQLCPLLLDLNGDGIHTTGLESAVRFWTLDTVKSFSGWTNPATEEAFLWLDTETDHSVTEAELFGSRMPAPGGGVHRNGFQALEKYDAEALGGNGDGRITARDRIWGRLRLWVDRDHDGAPDPTEISPPAAHGIVALNLSRVHDHTPYDNGNSLMLVGTYDLRIHGHDVQQRAMVDVGFTYVP
jgi:hypothetical protein